MVGSHGAQTQLRILASPTLLLKTRVRLAAARTGLDHLPIVHFPKRRCWSLFDWGPGVLTQQRSRGLPVAPWPWTLGLLWPHTTPSCLRSLRRGLASARSVFASGVLPLVSDMASFSTLVNSLPRLP